MVRETKRGHCAAFGPNHAGRLLVVVFERRRALVSIITGWDMNAKELRYWRRQRGG
jgi:uncharacterized DUF497 family protein